MRKEKTEERIREVRAQAAERRKRKAKSVLIGVLAVIMLYSVIAARQEGERFIRRKMALKNVRIIPESARPLVTGLVELQMGQNLFLLDKDDLRGSILLIQEIEDCSVLKSYPDTLEIRVLLRKAWIEAEKNGAYFFVDRNGRVVYPIKDGFVPFTRLLDLSIENNGAAEGEMWKLRALEEIEKSYNDNNLQKHIKLEAVSFRNKNEVVIYTGTGRIVTGMDELPGKFVKLKLLLEEFSKNGHQWDYIDTRFENPVVRHGNNTEENRQP